LAHIAYGDARLKLFTANILEIFEVFNLEKISKSSRATGGFRTRGVRGRGALVILVLALLAPLLKGLNRIFATGISLQREWRADATAVEYSRNPLALARALYRLGSLKAKSVSVGLPAPVRDYRESVASPAYSQLLLVPFDSASRGVKEISWWEKLFLSHPPVENRIARALNLARVPYSDFKQQVERERSSPQLDFPALRDEEGNLLHEQNWWIYADGSESETNLVDLLSGEGLTGEALIAREGDEDWSKPDQHRNLKAIKKLYENEKEKGNCPQCGAPFCRRFYLGVPIKVCLLCGGVALSWRKVIRLETRHRDGKLPERLGNIEDYTGYHGGEPIPEDEMIGAECPDCEIPFRTKRYHATKLIVDQCPNCNLTWFEEDELAIALNL
jgi:Zn-finger nucleic acid-binding protein